MKAIQLIAVFAIFSFGALAQSQNQNTNQNRDKNTNSDVRKSNEHKGDNKKNSDEKFIKEATKGGMKEVAMGKQGSTMASSTRVKNFAEMMVRDHTKANNELKSLTQKNKINVSHEDDMDNKKANDDDMKDMRNKSGMDYDKEYMDKMVKDHEKDIELFKSEAKNGKNATVKSWASKTLPVLEMHLDSAKAIQSSLKSQTSNQ